MPRLFLLFLLLSSQIFAEIRQIFSMQEIISEIDDNTLVVFDLDNTVIRPKNNLGSDQWYYYLVSRLGKKYKISRAEAHAKAEEIWNKTQLLIKTQAVESITPNIIKAISGQVLALTARSHECSQITRLQLANIGVNFNTNYYSENFLKLDSKAYYNGGILFQGEANNKGQVLVEFLKQINKKPQKILFIDDKIKHVENMHKALEEWGGVTHIEYRYANTDHQVQAFNEDVANAELYFDGEIN